MDHHFRKSKSSIFTTQENHINASLLDSENYRGGKYEGNRRIYLVGWK